MLVIKADKFYIKRILMKKNKLYISLVFLLLSFWGCAPSIQMVKPKTQSKKTVLKARDFFLKGVFLQQQARYTEALVEFYQALQYDSLSSAIYSAIAENHMKLAHYESAEMLLQKALKIAPHNLDALQLLAECRLRLGKNKTAISVFEEILKQNPYDDDARQYLLLLYEKEKDYKGLARQYEQLIKLYGADVRNNERLADLYLKTKQYEKALHYLNELLAADSTSAQIYYLIGQVKDKQNKPQEAAAYYKKALRFDPLLQGALERLNLWYRSNKDWQAVIDLYRPVLAADSTSKQARVIIAESYYYLEQFDQARKFLLPLVRGKHAVAPLLELMGRIEYESDRLSDAARYFRRSLEQNKKNKLSWLFLAFTTSKMDSLQETESIYRQAIVEFPDDASIWSYYGANLQRQEKYKKSIKAFEKALELDSLNRNALSSLPVVYETLKMYSRSDSLYEIGIRRLPEYDLLLNNFSYSLSERGLRMRDALEMVKKAVAAQPDNAAYLDTIGWIYFKLGKYNKAEQYIKKSVEKQTDSPVVLEHLGDVYAAMKNIEKAQKYWRQALELNKENTELLKKIEMNK